MITGAFIQLGIILASAIIAILPQSTGFSPNIVSSAASLGSYFGMLSPILPIGVLATCVGTVFTVEIAIFGWKTVKSLISHIPWIGGAGH